MVKGTELLHVVPHPLIRSMENVCAIIVHMDVVDGFGVAISADMVTTLQHQTFFSFSRGLVRKHASVKTRSHNDVIVFCHNVPVGNFNLQMYLNSAYGLLSEPKNFAAGKYFSQVRNSVFVFYITLYVVSSYG